MIGIFDSGVGGLCAFKVVREMLPYEDIIYLADRKNAPYGTKTKEEILKFSESNILRLKNAGAERVLIACCTASSLHAQLSDGARALSIPIITPAAMSAAESGRKICVIATDYTATNHVFSKEIAAFSSAEVVEIAAQRLVHLVEAGNRDRKIDKECFEYIGSLAEKIRITESDTLILGCTHFSHLEGEISRLLPKVKIISPARVGAEKIVKESPRKTERGRSIYT